MADNSEWELEKESLKTVNQQSRLFENCVSTVFKEKYRCVVRVDFNFVRYVINRHFKNRQTADFMLSTLMTD